MVKICQHCGKQFRAAKYQQFEHTISNNGENGFTFERVTLCVDCWLHLLDLRHETDDKFFRECTYGQKSNQE